MGLGLAGAGAGFVAVARRVVDDGFLGNVDLVLTPGFAEDVVVFDAVIAADIIRRSVLSALMRPRITGSAIILA